MLKNIIHLFQRKKPKQNYDVLTPQELPRPLHKYIRSCDLGIPPGIYTIVYEMDIFREGCFLSTSTELALYDIQETAYATPVDRRRDEENKIWYLRRIRERVPFGKPLAKLTARDVHDSFFPKEKLEDELKKEDNFFHDPLFERRAALFYESSMENILGDTYRRKNDFSSLRM